jgi:membrane protein
LVLASGAEAAIQEMTVRIPGFADVAPLAVMKRAVKDFFDDQMLTFAAALAYHIMLALFPFIIFLLTLLGALGLPEFFDWILRQARTALPPDTYGIVQGVVGEVRAQRRQGLLSFSIVFALWAASAGVRSLMTALNAAYDIEESRPLWQRFPLSVLYTIGLAVLLIVATGVMLLGPRVSQWLAVQVGLAPAVAFVWSILRWPIVVALLLVTVAIVYAIAPNIDQPFRFVTPGSVIAVAVWIVASAGFSYYVDNFANFSATYGGLGGVAILLLYFFVSAAVLLFGAEVNAGILRASAQSRDASQPNAPSRVVTVVTDARGTTPTPPPSTQ